MSSDGSTSSSSSCPLGKLKEPRDLYSTATLLHPIKWPVECQVIPEKIRHIDSPPVKLEPFYNPTGKEPQPQPVGAEMGTVVYDYQPKLSVDYFCRATVGGSQELDQFDTAHSPGSSGESTLKFESRFESGNLARAIKVTNTYYELYLRPDLYTERHAQWFYFRIQNTKEGVQYRFSIVNFNKPDSLYRYGLKVLIYSEKEAQLNGVGWVRGGQNIAYFKNDISPDDNGPYFTLTFNLKFKHNNDTVYLAQCYPYTYSTLQRYLKSIEEDEFKSQLLTIRLLCRSLAGNNVHVLTVTSPDNHNEQQQLSEDNTPVTEGEEGLSSNNKKPVIVISARVHPGETQSSYMMKGVIDFLTSDCSQAKELRDRFIFKLIPMLNPDGVIVGNSRCCLLGQDLNRQYRTVLREAFPQIYHAKVMLRRLQEDNGIFLYCDLHGHSRRHNVFIYGCENRRVPEKHLMEQVFPLMMHKNAADKFSFQNCKFKIQKNKEGTGRIFVWTLGVVNSYTLEISLGGSTMPSRQYTHFNTGDYEACGRHFCETLLDYSDPAPRKEILRERILQKLIDEGSTADEPKNVVLSDYSSLSHSETEGDDDLDSEREDDSSGPTNPTDDNKNSQDKKEDKAKQNKKELKRQVSQRKPVNFPIYRSKSASKSRHTPTEFIRSPMPIRKASVDFTRIKQRKLEEFIVQQTPTDLVRPNTPEPNFQISVPTTVPQDKDYSVGETKEKEMPMSAAFRRLTKFRRKTRRSPSVTSFPSESLHSPQHHQLQLQAKCTRILFDDPFNPPGTTWQRPNRDQPRQSTIPIVLNADHLLGFDGMDFNTNSAWQSGTEDECDPYDDMTIKRVPPQIKITDCDGDNQDSRKPSQLTQEMLNLTGDMSRLKVSSQSSGIFQTSSSDTESGSRQPQIPSFAPFTPSFPVGKAFLHQNFYPEKPLLTPRGKAKLTSSLSDTTLAEKDGRRSTITAPPTSPGRSPLGGIVRRSSISYGVLSTNLHSTGTSIPAKNSLPPAPPEGNSRRRVSWTGTLTVSVPTSVPLIPRSPPGALLNQHQRKSKFRKSKSLNDKQSQSQPSSTENDMGGGNNGKSRLLVRPSHSLSAENITPQTSSVKKRRAKLKRSKHK